MIIGLCGAQGSGKTTLGQEFARRHREFSFAATSTSQWMRERGMDPAKDYPIGERIAMQEIILSELDALYGRHSKNVVFDRTPLDAAAYMLADVQRENVSAQDQVAIERYLNRCIEVTNRRFSLIVFLPAVLGDLGKRDGKAPSSPAYVEHFSAIVGGLVADQRMKITWVRMRREMTDLNDRVAFLAAGAGKVLANYQHRKDMGEFVGEIH